MEKCHCWNWICSLFPSCCSHSFHSVLFLCAQYTHDGFLIMHGSPLLCIYNILKGRKKPMLAKKTWLIVQQKHYVAKNGFKLDLTSITVLFMVAPIKVIVYHQKEKFIYLFSSLFSRTLIRFRPNTTLLCPFRNWNVDNLVSEAKISNQPLELLQYFSVK